MVRRLGAEKLFTTARISEYEQGLREPTLRVLLAYGRVARIHLETIIDDESVLPNKIPGNFIYRPLLTEEINSKSSV
jgi:transcriptional regulator with XRE-family HTH domain